MVVGGVRCVLRPLRPGRRPLRRVRRPARRARHQRPRVPPRAGRWWWPTTRRPSTSSRPGWPSAARRRPAMGDVERLDGRAIQDRFPPLRDGLHGVFVPGGAPRRRPPARRRRARRGRATRRVRAPRVGRRPRRRPPVGWRSRSTVTTSAATWWSSPAGRGPARCSRRSGRRSTSSRSGARSCTSTSRRPRPTGGRRSSRSAITTWSPFDDGRIVAGADPRDRQRVRCPGHRRRAAPRARRRPRPRPRARRRHAGRGARRAAPVGHRRWCRRSGRCPVTTARSSPPATARPG